MEDPKLRIKFLLHLSVIAYNDALGSEGVVRSTLVLGEFPSLRFSLGPQPLKVTQAERAHAVLTARKDMAEAKA